MSSLTTPDKIKTKHFHCTKCLIDDVYAINNDGWVERSFCDIYPKERESKDENQSDLATFLNLDIIINEGTFIYKLFYKRDLFPFSIVRMPHIESNTPQRKFKP